MGAMSTRSMKKRPVPAITAAMALVVVACSSASTPDGAGGPVAQQRSALSAQAEEQIEICHHPPGDPSAGEDITVGAAALPAHLAHGDTEGTCSKVCVKGECCSEDPLLASTCICPCGIEGKYCVNGVTCVEAYYFNLPMICTYTAYAPAGSYVDHACFPPGASCVPSGGFCNAVVPCCSGTCPAASDGICP